MKIIHLLIVDDHPIIRDGLRNMLETQKVFADFRVFEAESESQAIEVVMNNPIDCVIMDFQLPDKKGHEITASILKINPGLKVLGLSNYDEYAYALDMLKAGAKGYVLKNVGTKDLLAAISQIMEGKVYYSNEIANKLINHKLKELLLAEDNGSTRLIEGMDENTPLSDRELQIIRLIAGELTNEEIANKLSLSKRTVDNHRQNMLNKLQIRNTAGLVRYAFVHGLI
jgi:DNA-binding NarL/FixJ family response regulator